jgi:hypothetical protein
VTICHATSSETNPYVQLQVDDGSIVKENGHDSHPGDIIPPFDYVDQSGQTQHYPGKNWDTSQIGVWENGCNSSTTTAAPTTSTEPTTTTPAPSVPIGLFVDCVVNHARTYDAVYGYTNDNRTEQIVPVGLSNTFLSAPGNRGQPTTFEPGTVPNAVRVNGVPNGTQLTWVVRLGNIRAAIGSQFIERKCASPPQPVPPNPRPPESGLFATCVLRLGLPRTYDAIFGYANQRRRREDPGRPPQPRGPRPCRPRPTERLPTRRRPQCFRRQEHPEDSESDLDGEDSER